MVTDKSLEIRVTCAPGHQVCKGYRLQLARCPEKVDISSLPMTPQANACKGTIRHIVYLGTVTHYYVTSEDGEAFVIYCQNQAASPSCGPLCVGDMIHLSWK